MRRPSAGHASPRKSRSTPAMIRSSGDFPAPVAPPPWRRAPSVPRSSGSPDGSGSRARGGTPARNTRAPRSPPSHPGRRPSSPRGGSRRAPRRRRSGWLASPSSISSLSRRPESGNHLAAERLGAPAPDAVNPRELGPIAGARQGDHRDQAVRQEQAGLDADAWRRLAAPLPEPLDAALDGGRDPGARAG